MSKRPSFQWYPADWRKDQALQSCSIAARGLWIDLLCIMHECAPYGMLSRNGRPMQLPQLARLVGESEEILSPLLSELEDAGVFSRDDNGVIFSRRMVKDERLRTVRASCGSLGGNPLLLNQKDNQGVNLTANQTGKQKPTPSSSSSSSSSSLKKEATASAPYSDYFDILKTIPDYPFHAEKDLAFFQEKEKDFPTIDILSLLKDWKIYILDVPFKKKSSPRSQLNNQFRLAMKLGKHNKATKAAVVLPDYLEKIRAAEREAAE